MASTAVTSALKVNADLKPVKLRSACNSCFTAKVRCDGNKDGCSRCIEKQLECMFSESKVGKVVGKRRKRPLPGSIACHPISEFWPPGHPLGNLPSPASTNVSETSSKRSCPDSSWTSFLTYDDQSCLDYVDSDYQAYAFKADGTPPLHMDTEFVFAPDSGLPTPSLSPPMNQFLSPVDLEYRPDSRQVGTSHNFVQPSLPASASKASDSSNDDEETVCIKLLSHIKKHAAKPSGSYEDQIVLLTKTNAAIARLLGTKPIRKDYTCQLLLSSIISHLTTVAERLCKQKPRQPSSSPRTASFPESYNVDHITGAFVDQQSRESIHLAVNETMNLCSAVGDLLKRKPLNGFQTLGRHESLHIEMDYRLRQALTQMS